MIANTEKSLQIGVIITTYNSPAWLEKVFWGYQNQLDENFELIIADDGSSDDTAQLIERYKQKLPCPVKHIWHEDKGFRKTEILNQAISKTDAPYLIFTDGDCIPKKNFISIHRERSQPGHFLSGGYYKLAMPPSQAISEQDITEGNAFNFKWLQANGQPKNLKRTKLTLGSKARAFMEWVTPTKASWNGMNSSAYRNDIISVNGFDERMQYGGLDREFGERLTNKGITGIQIRYSAICLHLDHPRGYNNPETWRKNNQMRAHVKKNSITWTDFGIEKQPVTQTSHSQIK